MRRSVTNNIIVNNVAGWDGGGVSLEDALAVTFVNNTVASNDSTATAGVLFNTLGAPNASSQTPATPTNAGNTSLPQPAGLVSMQNSIPLTAALTGIKLTCPANNPNCAIYSNPYMANNIFWENRSFYVGVGAESAQYQQNLVTLYNAFQPVAMASIPVNQTATGQCVTGSSYWDIGVRGDAGPGKHSTANQHQPHLSPVYSLMTNASEASTSPTNLVVTNPAVVSQYCNGSRVPPEFAAGTFNVPPGIADAMVPNPLFTLQTTATVDEGNNWVNLAWGPLSATNPTVQGTDGNYGGGAALGNYAITSASQAINHTPSTAGTPYALAPSTDFFGNLRKGNNAVDAGAVEYQPVATPVLNVTPTALAFTSVVQGSTSAVAEPDAAQHGRSRRNRHRGRGDLSVHKIGRNLRHNPRSRIDLHDRHRLLTGNGSYFLDRNGNHHSQRHRQRFAGGLVWNGRGGGDQRKLDTHVA